MSPNEKPEGDAAAGKGGWIHLLTLFFASVVALFAASSGLVLAAGGLQHSLGLAGASQTPPPAKGTPDQGGAGAPTLVSEAPAAQAGGPGAAAAGVNPQVMAEGQRIYAGSCMACHQATGQGVPNVFPPLVNSDWVCNEDADCAIAVVLCGLQGPIEVNGKPFSSPMIMPPHGAMLDDAKIAAVLTYVRNAWGHAGSEVPATRVAALRAKFKERTALWTQAEVHGAVHGAASQSHPVKADAPVK